MVCYLGHVVTLKFIRKFTVEKRFAINLEGRSFSAKFKALFVVNFKLKPH